MRIVFMGTAELAVPCLEAVAKMPSHEVIAVITQPDRPKGRDLKPAPPPVKVAGERLGIPVQQPPKIREPAAIDSLRAARPDLVIVVAYGQILPKSVLETPRLGCVNVHTSLLPRWRGAAPIQYAILHGDRETGVTTMYMDEHMDTGDIILQRAQPIRDDDTSATLHDRLAKLGAELLVETVGLIDEGKAPRAKQDEARATYAKKIVKEDGRIDWARSAVEIERQIRAFNPWPSAYTYLNGFLLKILKAEIVEGVTGKPGEVLADFIVATGQGGLRIVELRPSAGNRISLEGFMRARAVKPGIVLTTTEVSPQPEKELILNSRGLRMDRIKLKLDMDLTRLGKSVSCKSAEVVFDHNEQPIELDLTVSALDVTDLNNLYGKWGGGVLAGSVISGTLEDGRSFSTTLKAHTHVRMAMPEGFLVLKYIIDETRTNRTGAAQDTGLLCIFRVLNAQLRICDEITHLPLPPGLDPSRYPPGWVRNRVRFLLGGREWTLVDETVDKWSKSSLPDVNLPLATASLSTEVSQPEELQHLKPVADDICQLLSFALAKEVSWVSVGIDSRSGEELEMEARNISVRPFNSKGFSPVDNFRPGCLKKFIETAFPVYAREREWWQRTLRLYLEVQMSNLVEVKVVLLDTLADRISTSVLSNESRGDQISPNLSAEVEKAEFIAELHAVLRKLSSNWNEERTRAIVRTIKDWNAGPSFPAKIRWASQKLGISTPAGNLLTPRHRLVHEGELEVNGDVFEYWKELEFLVLMMVLRMLRYSGMFYHPKCGADVKLVKDFLAESTEPDRN